MTFTQALNKHIEKLVGVLKSEDELKEVLKRKFTKKELKTFVAFEDEKTIEEVSKLLKEDDLKRVEELYESAIKKLNQEKIKKELVHIK